MRAAPDRIVAFRRDGHGGDGGHRGHGGVDRGRPSPQVGHTRSGSRTASANPAPTPAVPRHRLDTRVSTTSPASVAVPADRSPSPTRTAAPGCSPIRRAWSAFLAVDRRDGARALGQAGHRRLGSRASTASGRSPARSRSATFPTATTRRRGSGELGPAQPLQDTGLTIGMPARTSSVSTSSATGSVPPDPDGATRWSRTFADSAFPPTRPRPTRRRAPADASHVLVDPHTGDTKLSCGPCTVSPIRRAWRSATPAMRPSSTSTGSTTASSSPADPHVAQHDCVRRS